MSFITGGRYRSSKLRISFETRRAARPVRPRVRKMLTRKTVDAALDLEVDAQVDRAELAVVLPLGLAEGLLDPALEVGLVDGGDVEALERALQPQLGRQPAAQQQVGRLVPHRRLEELRQRRVGHGLAIVDVIDRGVGVHQGVNFTHGPDLVILGGEGIRLDPPVYQSPPGRAASPLVPTTVCPRPEACSLQRAGIPSVTRTGSPAVAS